MRGFFFYPGVSGRRGVMPAPTKWLFRVQTGRCSSHTNRYVRIGVEVPWDIHRVHGKIDGCFGVRCGGYSCTYGLGKWKNGCYFECFLIMDATQTLQFHLYATNESTQRYCAIPPSPSRSDTLLASSLQLLNRRCRRLLP